MEIRCVVTGSQQERCYVLFEPGRDDCVVIDPGADGNRILSAAAGRKIAAILLTHCHWDHIGAVSDLLEDGTALCIHRADAEGLSDPVRNVSSYLFNDPHIAPSANVLLSDGDILHYAGMEFEVIHTPGHTPGSVCYQCGNAYFTGDTVLCGTCGRTDLPGGSEADMERSLARLLPLLRNHGYYGGH